MKKTKRLTRNALLTTIALTIFIIELHIPALVPIPGVKLGLSNIVTVFAMFAIGPVDTLLILLARIILGGIFSGQMMSLMYSFAGGLLCYLLMLIVRKIISIKQIWVCSMLGAVAHNTGQIAVAMLVTRTTALIIYYPFLLFSGLIAGLFTGLIAQFLVIRMQKDKNLFRKM